MPEPAKSEMNSTLVNIDHDDVGSSQKNLCVRALRALGVSTAEGIGRKIAPGGGWWKSDPPEPKVSFKTIVVASLVYYGIFFGATVSSFSSYISMVLVFLAVAIHKSGATKQEHAQIELEANKRAENRD